jgi:hypothetical protein
MNKRGLINSLLAVIALFVIAGLFVLFPTLMLGLVLFVMLSAFAAGVYHLTVMSEKNQLDYLDFNRNKHNNEPK